MSKARNCSRRLGMTVSGVAMAALLTIAFTCLGKTGDPLPDSAQMLVFATGTQPDSIDPALAKDAPTWHIVRPTYEALLRLKTGTTDVEPCLADTWEISADGLTYKFHLRPGVHFHDGTILDADAVKSSFERLIGIGLGPSFLFKAVGSVTVDGLDTVTFTLKSPDLDFLYSMTRFMIVSPASVVAHNQDGDFAKAWLSEHEAGTGPFKLESWEKGQVITLVRSDDYWGGAEGPKLRKLLFRYVSEAATQKLLLQNGEVQYADFLSADDANEFAASKDYVVYSGPSLSQIYIAMNTNTGPTADVNFRKAISYAFDYDTYVSQIMKGWSAAPNGPLPTPFSENLTTVPRFKRDLARAREYLSLSAYPNGGVSLDFVYVTGYDRYRQLGELLRVNLADLGINVELSPQPWATLTKMSTTPDLRPDLLEYGYSATIPSAFSFLYAMYRSNTGHWAQFGYSNPTVDALLDSCWSASSLGERAEALLEVQRLLLEDMPQVFVEERTQWWIFSSSVRGVVYDPPWYLWPNWWDMYLVEG